jgi:hypothetical protein
MVPVSYPNSTPPSDTKAPIRAAGRTDDEDAPARGLKLKKAMAYWDWSVRMASNRYLVHDETDRERGICFPLYTIRNNIKHWRASGGAPRIPQVKGRYTTECK